MLQKLPPHLTSDLHGTIAAIVDDVMDQGTTVSDIIEALSRDLDGEVAKLLDALNAISCADSLDAARRIAVTAARECEISSGAHS